MHFIVKYRYCCERQMTIYPPNFLVVGDYSTHVISTSVNSMSYNLKVSFTSLGIARNKTGRNWRPEVADVGPRIVLSMNSIDISGRNIQFIQALSARKSTFFVPIIKPIAFLF